MSSFIGHSLAATGVFLVGEKTYSHRGPRLWLMWLIFAASIPDIDYIFRVFIRSGHLRVSHSILGSLTIPLLTIIVLAARGSQASFLERSIQVSIAGLSHILLDLLVGVTPLPLLWPLSSTKYRLPFGVLPSAGRIAFDNPFLYRNLAIELGVLVPIVIACSLVNHQRGSQMRKPIFLGLLVISVSFMALAWRLVR